MAAIAFAGCGAGAVIDEKAAAIDVREGFEELGVKASAIDCPADVDAERGAPYVCRAETPKGTFRVVYTQLDEEGTVGMPRLEKVPGSA